MLYNEELRGVCVCVLVTSYQCSETKELTMGHTSYLGWGTI